MNKLIEQIFTYHPPFGDQPLRYKEIRAAAAVLGKIISKHCPDSRERSVAITKLQSVVMWANAAIAINEENKNDPGSVKN